MIEAEGEAEALCAQLNAHGLADACASSDVDAVLFGAVTLYKKLHLQVCGSRAIVVSPHLVSCAFGPMLSVVLLSAISVTSLICEPKASLAGHTQGKTIAEQGSCRIN